MAAKRILFIDTDAPSRRFVSTALARDGYDVQLAASGPEGLIAAWRDTPDLILVDPGGADLRGEDLAAKLRADPRTAGLPLVALSSDADPARQRACMQAGFSDYLVKSPQVMPALTASLAQLLPGGAAGPRQGGLLIAFLSAKGGTGTSTLCANIAMNMALSRPQARIVLADLVLPIGSIAGIVGYAGEQHVVGLSHLETAETNGEFMRNRLPNLSSWRFRLLAGSPNPDCGNELNVGRIGEIVASLQQAYDFVLLDLGRSLSRISIPLIERADLVAMVVSTDPATVQLSRTVWEYLQSKGIRDSAVYVILNRAAGPGGLTKDEAEKVLGLHFNVALPHQAENFSLANTDHQPYSDRFPSDTTSIVLREAALQVMDLAARARAA